jgi:hypothetical protein
MLVIGSRKFLDFSYEVNFMDHVSRLKKKGDKIMFRVANQFYRLASSNSQSLQKNTYSFFRNCNTCANDPVDILIKKADDLARIGKIRKAEDIYKKIIDNHPTHETAYQKLWNSWVSTRSLKITQKEFDEFEKKYHEHILSKNNFILGSDAAFGFRPQSPRANFSIKKPKNRKLHLTPMTAAK